MENYDLLIIGSGSGNSLVTPDFDDKRVALVEKGVFGGTCLNVGCIPSKMFVYTGDLATQAGHSERFGIRTSFDGVDWPAVRDRVFGRIDPIAAGGEHYRTNENDNVTVYKGVGRFTGPKQLEVNGETITADNIVLAAGARSFAPDVPGLAEVGFHTSDTIMRIDELPKRLTVLGGGYIASELGHVFGSLGVDLTIINRSAKLLRNEDADVSDRFTEIYQQRFSFLLNTTVDNVSQQDSDGPITMTLNVEGESQSHETDMILVATGRVPNADTLGTVECGVDVDERGYVTTDDYGRTNVDGVWALGDITTSLQLKHSANHEAKIVAHNIANPDDLKTRDLSLVPHAVFGHPQVAAVGKTEAELVADGTPYVSKVQNYGDTAYGWAMEDTESFVKLLAHAETRELLGAHLLGPQASTLIQQLIQGMRFGQTVDEMATGQMYIHPALSEVVEKRAPRPITRKLGARGRI